MPTPDFILSLRERVGHDLLWLSGVTAVVLDDTGRVLLGRRSDTGVWSLPSGILEPGEQPATGLAREVLEETCAAVSVQALVSVWSQPEVTYPNGDRSQYLDLTFLCRHVGGEPRVGDGELTEVAWFSVDDLPPDLRLANQTKITRALSHRGPAWFESDSAAADSATGAQLATLVVADQEVMLRAATPADLPALVTMLAHDQLGATREDPTDLEPYAAALAAIDADPAQLLVVADDDGEPVAMVQLSILPGLSRRGAGRGLLEGVRVAASHRGTGLGTAMITWCIEESRRRGCALVQLTTDSSRVDAQRFYERLGFVASHVGMKLRLED